MNTNRKSLRLLACFVVFVLIICQSCMRIIWVDTRPDKIKMLSFFLDHEDMMKQLLLEAEGHYISFWNNAIKIDLNVANPDEVSEAMRWAARNGIGAINGTSDNGEASFSFRWANYLLEGHIELSYHPLDIPPIEQWMSNTTLTLVEESKHRWHWTGCGIGGSGYILVERLHKNLFYAEVYWPT